MLLVSLAQFQPDQLAACVVAIEISGLSRALSMPGSAPLIVVNSQ